MATPIRVLIVEDSEDDAQLLVRELRRGGYDPAWERVETAEAMRSALEKSQWDLVVSDYQLPQFSGPDALELFRGAGIDIPFIIVSGAIGEPRAVEVMKAGAHDYVMKGHWARLVPAIQRELRDAETRRARRRTEEALRRSEERLRHLLATGPAIIYSCEASGDYAATFVSENVSEQFGYTASDFTVEPDFWARNVHPDDAPRVFEDLKNLFARGHHTHEYRFRHKDGRYVWVNDVLNLIRDEDGKPIHIVGHWSDITERKRAEARLREAELRYRTLFDRAPYGVVLIDLETTRAVDFNDVAARQLGYSREEFAELRISDYEAIEAAEETAGHIRNVLAEGRDDFETSHRAKSGGLRDVAVSAQRIELSGRSYILAIYQDVTERRDLEKQLRRSEKLEAVGQLAGGVAHEFNNILMGISGYAQLLQPRVGADPEVAKDLDRIRQLAQRGGDLAKQLLTFSRQERAEQEFVDLSLVVKNACKMLRKVLPESLEFKVAAEDGLGAVRADPGHIEQVLVNLAVNARDAMPGTGTLTIETANVEIDGAFATAHGKVEPGRYAMLAVSDTGCGMDEVTRSRIFEPFFTTKEVGKGTGLGLATVYGIVQQHGGHVTVYSEPGKGSTFKVYLPCVAAPARELEEVPGRDALPHGSETILLVEDDESVRNVVRGLLEQLGYAVIEAGCPAEAEQIFRTHMERIALLVTDVIMPGGSGGELYARLTAKRPDLKVVFISGYAPHAAVWQGPLPKGADFLQKPFSLEKLSVSVRQALDARAPKRVA